MSLLTVVSVERCNHRAPSKGAHQGGTDANTRRAAAVALNCILKRHGLGRGLSPAWKAALGDVRVSLDPRFSPSFAKLCAQPFDRPRSKIWDASERFICGFSEIADSFQSGEFYRFRIRVGKRTISTRVSFGRSGPRSIILQAIHLAFFSANFTSRRNWSAWVR